MLYFPPTLQIRRLKRSAEKAVATKMPPNCWKRCNFHAKSANSVNANLCAQNGEIGNIRIYWKK